MAETPPAVRYRFGAFELDPTTGELRRRGLRVRVGGRPVEILTVLLERPGELVTREDLRGRLWSTDTFVDFDHGLNSAMNKLRDGLGDAADNPRFIETVPRRGYKFIAPVEVVQAARQPVAGPARAEEAPAETGVSTPAARPEPAGSSPELRSTPGEAPAPASAGEAVAAPRWRIRPWFLAAAAVVLGAVAAGIVFSLASGGASSRGSGRAMLIVLPFDNLSGAGSDDFFAEGMTDELIAQLGALDPGQLGVIARTTAMQYRGSGKGVMEIGKELGVDYVLEGSIRRDRARARITAQLVDVGTQTQLWTETYERDLADVLMLQRDIATRVARSLAGGVLSPVLERGMGRSPKFAAYELVLRARMLRQRATEADAWQCVATFEEAIRVDPGYAPAHAGLADCYRLLGAPGWEAGPPDQLLERARTSVERALELDPQLAEAHAVRGMVRFSRDWDLPGADRDLARAIAINPSYARAYQYRSAVLAAARRFDEAVDSARRATEVDPLSLTESTTLGIRLYYAGRHPEAVAQFMRTLTREAGFPVLHWGLGVTYREQGRHDEAIAELRRAVELSGNSAYMRAWLGHALYVAGRRAEGETIRADIERLAGERYVSPFLLALLWSGAGDRARTLELLQQTRDARSGWIPFLSIEPQFRWLHGDPVFERLSALP